MVFYNLPVHGGKHENVIKAKLILKYLGARKPKGDKIRLFMPKGNEYYFY
jgi:hypothetical protein